MSLSKKDVKCDKNQLENKEKENNNEDETKKEKDTLSRKVSFIRESVSDSGVPERKLSTSVSVDATKRSSLRSQDAELHSSGDSPKVPRKFITTWRHACDRTKDRTRELLKRWRTLPEGNTEMAVVVQSEVSETEGESNSSHNWSVHVWASYIKRYTSEDEDLLASSEANPLHNNLSATQKEKFGHFFSHLLDTDHDDMISLQDFENFSERLRRFADWTINSSEFLIALQVQHGLASTFLPPATEGAGEESPWKQYSGLDLWFHQWSSLLTEAYSLSDCPVWLQYLPKLLFQAINRSRSGSISRDELSTFYSSMVGLTSQRVGEILDQAFNTLTSNGDHPISYSVYRLAFTNFLLGRHPNGPGQVLFGCMSCTPPTFPIDYSALNAQPEELEHYSPDKRTNRVSVIV